MTDQAPDELFEPVEESFEPQEETFAAEVEEEFGAEGEENPTKRCLFCGQEIPAPAKACFHCGHALGPFEANTPKEYFRWFFCGLLIFMGSLMPCGPGGAPLTITTMAGGLFAIMGLGVMWNMWSAIYSGRFKMFWVVMLFIPALWGLWRIAFAFAGAADDPTSGLALMTAHGFTGWGSLGDIFASSKPNWGILRNFFSVIGYGPITITFASILAWFLLVSGMFGAVKHTKKKAAERSASGGRGRRR